LKEFTMHNVFIVGGAGQIARRLAPLLAVRGHAPRSLHRRAKQAKELEQTGAVPVLGGLLAPDSRRLARRMNGSDAVVFAAGAGVKGGPQMTFAIDGRGLELAVAAAKQAGIARFLLVSAFPKIFRERCMPEAFENYMAVKKLADVHLAASGLDRASCIRAHSLMRRGPASCALVLPFRTAECHATTWYGSFPSPEEKRP
jgi:uncharacterized protein YbjT (DUF2867 family)